MCIGQVDRGRLKGAHLPLGSRWHDQLLDVRGARRSRGVGRRHAAARPSAGLRTTLEWAGGRCGSAPLREVVDDAAIMISALGEIVDDTDEHDGQYARVIQRLGSQCGGLRGARKLGEQPSCDAAHLDAAQPECLRAPPLGLDERGAV